MPRLTRLRRLAKWTGVGLCLAILLTWSICVNFFPALPKGQGTPLTSDSGVLISEYGLYFYNIPADTPPPASTTRRPGQTIHWQRHPPPPALRPDFDPRLWPTLCVDSLNLTPAYGPRTRYVFLVAVPFWLLLLSAAVPTALLVLNPERPRISLTHCRKCKYSLAGNVSGRCPECGTIIPTFRPSTAAQLETAHLTPRPPGT